MLSVEVPEEGLGEEQTMKRIVLAVSMILCILVSGCTQKSSDAAGSQGYTIIKAEEAKKMMDAGDVIIVDVRTESEYSEKHIPNAINIPVESITTEKLAQLPDLEATILVYCRTGIRAATASKKLSDMGYTKIYDMGGIVDWPYDTVTN
jgi:rhodanese-related sulfurtransferase